jgi:hypothetical protein
MSEFIRMSHCSRKTMIASKYIRNYIGLGRSPTFSLRESSSACSSVQCFEVLTIGCVRRERGRRVVRDCPNEVSRVHPIGRVTWRSLYRVRWLGHIQRDRFFRPSGRESEGGKTTKLGLQGRPSCPGITAHSGVVVVMVSFPRRIMA